MGVAVKDMDETARFYREVVGMKLTGDMTSRATRRWPISSERRASWLSLTRRAFVDTSVAVWSLGRCGAFIAPA
jgi:catechol 2,3-dioxygenase-like lactoylglutathione lyase family enzyme